MTISAASISVVLSGFNGADVPPEFLYSAAAGAITGAMSITGLWVLYQSRESLATMMRLSGHWMIFCFGTNVILAWFLPSLLMFWFPDAGDNPPDWATTNAYAYRVWQSLVPFTIGATATAAYGYASWKNEGIWRWLFGLGAFFCFADMLIPISISFFPIGSGVPIWLSFGSYLNAFVSAAMVLVACFGRQDGEHRDWLHWLGVSLAAVWSFPMILWNVVAWFL